MALKPYRQAVGCLMYLATGTRPDLAFAIQLVSRFGSNPGKPHWEAVKHIYQYVKQTKQLKLTFTKQGHHDVKGSTDADWESCEDTRRSNTGFGFFLSGAAISWCSRRQKTVSLSSCESEYVAATEATREAVWIRAFLEELEFKQTHPTVIQSDSQSALQLISNPVFHDKTKHIQARMHFVRERASAGEVYFEKVHTSQNVADALTKGVVVAKVKLCRSMMGLQ